MFSQIFDNLICLRFTTDMWDILGVDWGEQNCGLAFGNLATGLVIPDTKANPTTDIIATLKIQIKNRQPKKIVVGLPTNFKLQKTQVTEQINLFVEQLKTEFDIEVLTINERNTTKNANYSNNLKKHELDNLSAKKILEIYLEFVVRNGNG